MTALMTGGIYMYSLTGKFNSDIFNNMSANAFRTDIKDEGSHYVVESELPGFDRDDINVDISDGYMTVSASHRTENEKSSEDGSYICRERSYGSYSRSFDLSGVDSDSITAEYKNGILRMVLPKSKAEQSECRRLTVN